MSTFYQRSAIEILEDAITKHRVLKGIALLEEKHGPDWAATIDLDLLDLGSSTCCVLGQLYHDEQPDDNAVANYAQSVRFERNDYQDDAREWLEESDGYERGIAILDGPLTNTEHGPEQHGFEYSRVNVYDLRNASDEQLEDIGVTREMVHNAISEAPALARQCCIDYSMLYDAWYEEIAERQGR